MDYILVRVINQKEPLFAIRDEYGYGEHEINSIIDELGDPNECEIKYVDIDDMKIYFFWDKKLEKDEDEYCYTNNTTLCTDVSMELSGEFRSAEGWEPIKFDFVKHHNILKHIRNNPATIAFFNRIMGRKG